MVLSPRSLLLLGACVAVQATGTSVDGLSEKARIRLLRQLAEVATGSALPRSPPLSLPRPSVVSEAVGRFVQPWQARQTAEAAEALLQLGSELVRMVAALKADRVSYTAGETSGADTLEMVAQQCQQLASYIGQPGMEDGKHTDYPRLIDLVFNLVWTLSTLGQHDASMAAFVHVAPADLGTCAQLLIDLPAAQLGQTENAVLAQYAVPHTLLVQGHVSAAVPAIHSALTSVEKALSQPESTDIQVLHSIFIALHSLHAYADLVQGARESAAARCQSIAAVEHDFNGIYQCVLSLLPLPLPANSPRFTLTEIHAILVHIRDHTAHGGSSVTNLHLWDIEQWLSFGSRGQSLLHKQTGGVAERGTETGSQVAAATIPGPLQCDTVESARVGSTPLLAPRLLIVMPVVAKEGPRLRANFRQWQRDRHFPCDPAARSEAPLPSLMLLFSRAAGESPGWLGQSGERLDELIGDAAVCFGRRWVRFANLSAAEEFYKGGWVATGPNNLFYPLFDDASLHREHDYLFWMETDAFPVRRNWLTRLRAETAAPRGFWRKGPTQRPAHPAGLLGVVGTHHYHMNAVGFYRLGDPCYREYLRRVREEHLLQPFDVSQHCFLHDRRHFPIFQEWAHKFIYTDVLQNWVGPWSAKDVAAASPNTVIVHGKGRSET